MAGDNEVPSELFEGIPEDADPMTKLYMRAQTVIQAAFYSLGDREISPGEITMENAELETILATALAILIAADPSAKSKRDLRLQIEAHAKHMIGFAAALKHANDTQVFDVLDILRLRRSKPN